MKTTIEIDDELLREAKIVAAASGVTLRALVERGLRHELEQIHRRKGDYVPRDASVGGSEINPEFMPWHWDKVRDLIYNDELLRQAEIRAAERGETLRELVERGLRRELGVTGSVGHDLPDGRFRGEGGSVDDLDWAQVRDEAIGWRMSGK